MTNRDVEDITTRLQQLQLQRESILREEQELLRRLTGETTREPEGIAVGDRVFIENRISHVPLGRRATPKDCAAIVQRVDPKRIYITTYNGYSTWRAPTNLRRLTECKHKNILSRFP